MGGTVGFPPATHRHTLEMLEMLEEARPMGFNVCLTLYINPSGGFFETSDGIYRLTDTAST